MLLHLNGRFRPKADMDVNQPMDLLSTPLSQSMPYQKRPRETGAFSFAVRDGINRSSA